MATVEEVLAYWLDEVGPSGWYKAEDAVDEEIRARFLSDWEQAREGGLGLWLTHPTGVLAYLVVTDQFSRNLHRGSGLSFAVDPAARAVAKAAIRRDWDLKIDAPARQFFYLPFMHSENLLDQDRSVRLFRARMPGGGGDNLLHACAHRQVIRDFGRFPYRNEALGRETTAEEQAFLDAGAYGGMVRRMQEKAAARPAAS